MAKLLTIVQVDKDSRVYCQAPECNRTVYKRIHVVEDDGRILVLGSGCYSILYEGAMHDCDPIYFFGADGRKLTEEERNLLHKNTRELIEKFKNEISEIIEEKEQAVAIETDKIISTALPSRHVNCSYCGMLMTTRAKSIPAIGYKCDTCTLHNRPTPSRRMRISKEMNYRANQLLNGVQPPHQNDPHALDAAEAYRIKKGK